MPAYFILTCLVLFEQKASRRFYGLAPRTVGDEDAPAWLTRHAIRYVVLAPGASQVDAGAAAVLVERFRAGGYAIHEVVR